MSEVVIAHYRHRHEAELAQGFLADARVPSRVVSDPDAGGSPYIGGLAGASLVVAAVHAPRAGEVLRSAGMIEEAAAEPPVAAGAELSPALRADLEDLDGEIERARKEEMRHFVFSMLGVSPAAIIPLVGLAREGSVALLALLAVLVVFVEGWRWIRAGREVQRLVDQRARLLARAREDGGGGRIAGPPVG